MLVFSREIYVITGMTRKLFELNHPLYPHKDLKQYYEDHKVKYYPYQGSMDEIYNNWYRMVRADHDIGGAPKRDIYSEITQIIRLKSADQDYLLYSETLYGLDHEFTEQPFFHTYGYYKKPTFRTMFNYDTRTAYTVPSGNIKTVYFIKYDPKLIDDLYAKGPDNQDIELLVNVGSKQYGTRGFFKYEDFRDMKLEDLGRKGASGEGMYTKLVTQVPASEMTRDVKAMTAPNAQEWNEFLEFQRFKDRQRQQEANQNSANTSPRIKVKAVDEK